VPADARTLEIDSPKRAPVQGRSLGLRLRSKASVIDQIKRGLGVAALERLGRELQITTRQLADVASITKRTLARRKLEGKLQPLESERVYRIAAVFDRAVDVLGDAEHARQWLKTPRTALRGETPLRHADTEVGAREVEELLGRLEHGVFS
jgi:putative toxin-antitoxin system antitoxin component (TIGR02293 family)